MWARNICKYLGGIYFNRVCFHHLRLPLEWWDAGNYLIPAFLTLSFCTWPLFRAVTSSAITTLCSSLPVFIHSGVNYACRGSARGAGEYQWVGQCAGESPRDWAAVLDRRAPLAFTRMVMFAATNRPLYLYPSTSNKLSSWWDVRVRCAVVVPCGGRGGGAQCACV